MYQYILKSIILICQYDSAGILRRLERRTDVDEVLSLQFPPTLSIKGSNEGTDSLTWLLHPSQVP